MFAFGASANRMLYFTTFEDKPPAFCTLPFSENSAARILYFTILEKKAGRGFYCTIFDDVAATVFPTGKVETRGRRSFENGKVQNGGPLGSKVVK